MMNTDWGAGVEYESIQGEIAIVGIGETAHTGPSGRDPVQMAAEAIECALADAGLRPAEVDGLMVAGSLEGQFTPQAFERYFGPRAHLWFSGEGGAATAVGLAPYVTAQAMRRGEANVVVNVFGIDWATQIRRGTASPGESHLLDPMKADFEAPFGWYPQPAYFATMARRHEHEFGTTDAQRGALAVAQRRHANGHPGAVMHGRPLTLDAFLAGPMLMDPLRKEDCCLISDGACAFVMTSSERARDLRKRPAIVEGVGEGIVRAGIHSAQQTPFTSTPQRFSAPAAFAMARVGPADVDVLAVYDCSSITALMQIEDMGFCAKGDAGPFVEGDRLSFDRPRRRGGLPFNTHGGLMSHSYVLGTSHIIELVRQLRGEAANQVERAEIGVYGGYAVGNASTLILSAGSLPGR